MEKRTVVVDTSTLNSPPGVTSVTLEIIPDSGYVVAARDFVAGANPDAAKINSITLADSESSGGPQNDGSYTANNKVIVTVDFVDSYAPTQNITLDIDPSGSATAKHLVPVKLQGTFIVPDPLVKVTFTPSSVLDFASSGSTTDFYAYDNPGDTVTIMVMTIAATTNDFIDEDPTIAITNSSDSTAAQDYQIDRVNTFDSSNRLTQVVYTVKAVLPKVSRNNDVITFTGAGADDPDSDKKIYGYRMNTGNAGLEGINRRLEIFGDVGAQFRIKMQRGTLSGSTYTTDSTDGIYVFDNSQTTIADIFEVSTSTTTYPSEIQSDGSYEPATNPYTLGSTGLFFKNILIPADVEDKVYRFTITPETGTTVDTSAPGIDTAPDPDVITFDITRNGDAFFTANYDGRSGSTSTVEYFDHIDVSKGSTEPRGKKNSSPTPPSDEYGYDIVVTDTSNDFHLPNQANSFVLSDINYTKTLNSGRIIDPKVTAELRATADGFNAAAIQSTGYANHAAAEAVETDTSIVLTFDQREALTNKTSFNASSFRSSFTVTGTSQFFKIKFFTTDATPVYKSQTIEISSTFYVSGDIDNDGTVNQQNTTTLTAPAVDRTKLYLTARDLTIQDFGTSDITFEHNLDTFAFTSAQSLNTLDLTLNISQLTKKFVNSISRGVGYTLDKGYSILTETSTDGTSYSKANITKSTSHIKLTVTGAFLNAEDGLPSGYTTSNYNLLFLLRSNTSDFSNTTLSVPAQPTVTLTDASNVNRKLAIATFSVIIDFTGGGGTNDLASLSISQSYVFNADIVHRFNSTYESIGDVEESLGNLAGSPGLQTY
jgi:hypothetical protein